MEGCGAVLRHGLEAPEGLDLALSLDQTFYGLGSQRSDQLVLEIRYTREEADLLEGLVGGDRNGRAGECAADVTLFGDVVHAANVRAGVCAHELRENPREVRYAGSRPDLDVIRARIATDARGERANRGCIAFALDEHQGAHK